MITKGMVSASVLGLFLIKCVSTRNVRSPLYLGFEKGFVVAATNKVK